MFTYPKSAELILNRFRVAIANDRFDFGRPASSVRFDSVRNFIRVFQGKPGIPSEVTSLKCNFAEFLGLSVFHDNNVVEVSDLIRLEFCDIPFKDLLTEVSSVDISDKEVNTADISDEIHECQVADRAEWIALMSGPRLAPELVNQLFDVMSSLLRERSLLSFFVVPPTKGSFQNIGSWNYSGRGTPLKTRVIGSDYGDVRVEVSRYNNYEMGTDVVRAYEWNARLRTHGASEDCAGACGMVYIFLRDDGIPIGAPEELIAAADAVNDRDVLQAQAFLLQHQDSDEVIDESDLCFVWLWERREGARNGIGADCLRAAVTDLRRRFKTIRTLVIDTTPMQFVDWDQPDFAVVEVMKQEAIESIVEYVSSCSFPGVIVRHIFNRLDDDHYAALHALNESGLDR